MRLSLPIARCWPILSTLGLRLPTATHSLATDGQCASGTGRFTGQDDFFTVRFTNTATSAFLDFNLADYRGNTDYVVTSWRSFNLSSLEASQLSISFQSSRETNYTPRPIHHSISRTRRLSCARQRCSHLVTSVPEPSSCVLLLTGFVHVRPSHPPAIAMHIAHCSILSFKFFCQIRAPRCIYERFGYSWCKNY